METRASNQAVKCNAGRFPQDFKFQISEYEWKNLKSQFVISSWGGSRHLPLAFTEHGVYHAGKHPKKRPGYSLFVNRKEKENADVSQRNTLLSYLNHIIFPQHLFRQINIMIPTIIFPGEGGGIEYIFLLHHSLSKLQRKNIFNDY